MHDNLPESVLLSHTLATADGQHIGVLQLNRPKALNALNGELIQALRQQLQAWAQDASVVAVWLEGSERALCAGGDIRALQQTVQAAHDADTALSQSAHFFEQEYGLYADMAHYPKPIIAWASGIVMGGGLGLVAASSIRIVTETTMMAMPEISIGLFPDAGANAFLQHFPFKSGVFLGLTGSRFNASDALLGNLAEFGLYSHQKQQVLEALQQASWQQANALSVVQAALLALPPASLPEGQLLNHQASIRHIVQQATFAEALKEVLARRDESAWMAAAADFVAHGCATSAALHWHLMQKCRHLSLKQVLALEHRVATHCVTRADFLEGVRALLIDKDQNPQWLKQAQEVDEAWVASFLQPLPVAFACD